MPSKTGSTEKNACFVIMPISDVPPYEVGHFRRVYDHIIKPACELANLKPLRADDVYKTNHIVINVLQEIINAKMVICDLSGKNPNVLYELGIRQAFDLPVTLIKDTHTPRIFDIQGLRDIEYDEKLRIDNVNDTINLLYQTLENNLAQSSDDVNSIIQLLGIKPATHPTTRELSNESSLLLNAIRGLGERLFSLEEDLQLREWNYLDNQVEEYMAANPHLSSNKSSQKTHLRSEDISKYGISKGDTVIHRLFGD